MLNSHTQLPKGTRAPWDPWHGQGMMLGAGNCGTVTSATAAAGASQEQGPCPSPCNPSIVPTVVGQPPAGD